MDALAFFPIATVSSIIKMVGLQALSLIFLGTTHTSPSSDDGMVEFGSAKYYALCGFGGVLSCGLTHTMVTPLDLVKCRLQVDKEKYKSLGNGFKVRNEC